jgi:hypothetical protein
MNLLRNNTYIQSALQCALIAFFCLPVFFPATPVTCAEVDKDVQARLSLQTAHLGSQNYQAASDAVFDRLAANQRKSFAIQLVSGVANAVVAVCGPNCDHIQLLLYDHQHRLLVQSPEIRGAAIVGGNPTYTGLHEIEVAVPGCHLTECEIGFVLMRQEPAGPKSANSDAAPGPGADSGFRQAGSLANCDRLMAVRLDPDRPSELPPMMDTESLDDQSIEQAVIACTAAAKEAAPTPAGLKASRRYAVQAGRAYAARAVRRARSGDGQAARSGMDRAIGIWKQAAEDGSGTAHNFLGAYFSGTFNREANGFEFISADAEQALRHWNQGAAAGNPSAMANAGGLLLGDGDPAPAYKDVKLALTWLNKAKQLGEVRAAIILGGAYYYGSPSEIKKDVQYGLELLALGCAEHERGAKQFFDREIERKRLPDSKRPSGC